MRDPIPTTTNIVPIADGTLQALIDRAMSTLAGARSAAEVLEARDLASLAYDIAKKAGRLAKVKQAADDVILAAYRLQADALDIDFQANRRLAEEYGAAQERGEVHAHGGQSKRDITNENIPSVADLGMSSKDIHEARIILDAEKADPGIVRRTVDAAVNAGEEPTRAKVKRAVNPDPKQSGKDKAAPANSMTVAALAKENARLRARIEKLQHRVAVRDEQIKWLKGEVADKGRRIRELCRQNRGLDGIVTLLQEAAAPDDAPDDVDLDAEGAES